MLELLILIVFMIVWGGGAVGMYAVHRIGAVNERIRAAEDSSLLDQAREHAALIDYRDENPGSYDNAIGRAQLLADNGVDWSAPLQTWVHAEAVKQGLCGVCAECQGVAWDKAHEEAEVRAANQPLFSPEDRDDFDQYFRNAQRDFKKQQAYFRKPSSWIIDQQ